VQLIGRTVRNGDHMPKVGSKHYPYTKEGYAAAAKARAKRKTKTKRKRK